MKDDHGSPHTYKNYGCRCAECRKAATAYMGELHRRRVEKARVGLIDVPHGTANGYRNYGCRCEDCGRAYSKNSLERGYISGQRVRLWEKKDAVVACAVEHGARAAAQRFGVPRQTVYRWLDEEGVKPYRAPLAECGTRAAYVRGCRCSDCSEAIRAYWREAKRRSREDTCQS